MGRVTETNRGPLGGLGCISMAALGLSLQGSRSSTAGPRSSGTLLLAYLFDGTLEASLLVLHPVHLSEGASAQAGLARGPVDLLSVLIIYRFQLLGLAGEKRPGSVARATEERRVTVSRALQPASLPPGCWR